MADLKQLPGLTAQERESISAYLSILFKLYFQPKEGQNVENNSKKLFDLCSKVLKDYCIQQSELIAINNSKQQEGGKKNSGDFEDEAEADNEDRHLSLSDLHENELERQLQNITPIVSNIILANLLKLSDDDVSFPQKIKRLNTFIAKKACKGNRAFADRPIFVQSLRDKSGQ